MRTGENIHKRKDGRWEARVPIKRNSDGRLVYKFLYGRTYREAKEKKVQCEKQYQYSKCAATPAQRYLFRDIANEWLSSHQSVWKPSTYSKYQNCLQKYILPKWESRFTDELTQEDYDAFITTLRTQDNASACETVNLILRSIKKHMQVTKKASLSFIMDTVPFFHTAEKEMKPFTDAEWKTLTDYCLAHPGCTSIGILISLYEGLRIGELCALRWENVDLEMRSLHIRETVQRLPRKEHTDGQSRTLLHFGLPKNGKMRTIPIHPRLYDMLAEAKNQYAPEAFLLSGTEHVTEPRTFSNRFHKVLNECHIRKVNAHLLRHSFASSCVEAGMDTKALSEILGHKTVKITMDRYVHLSMQYKTKQLEKLSFSSDNQSQKKSQLPGK